MPDFGEIVMVETNGPNDMDQAISLGGGLILREDGQILSPDVNINPLDVYAPVSDIRDVIFSQVRNEIERQVQTAISDEIKEQITDKIMELLQNAADYTFDQFSDLVQTAIMEVSQRVLENIDVIILANNILKEIMASI